MRNSFFLLLLLFLFSCKPPLPVYFDKPLGKAVPGFDTLIAGNYIPLEDVVDRGTKEFTKKYTVKYDKIVPSGSETALQAQQDTEINRDVRDILGIKKDSAASQNCDSVFHSFCAFTPLISGKILSHIDKMGLQNPKAAMIKIAYDGVIFIALDSLGKNRRDTLLSLSRTVVLTKYSGKYFLNFKTPFGWELMQLDTWENRFLSVRPFYFTGYNDCAKNVSELTASTKNIYPGLSPVLNPEKKLIGFRAALDPARVLDRFAKSEEVILLLKVN